MIRTRFPPSPTGFFHVGSARTALYNFLFARKNGGKCLLRIEDTDKERSRVEYEKNIFDSLSWLGINFDGKILKQSERTDIYKEKILELITNDSAYVSSEPGGKNTKVIRFKNPGGKIVFKDLIRGEVEMDISKLGDFIIAKNTNEPLYHLAVVVDDIESQITHVIRGEDHISNTPRQILLIEALGAKRPIYAHLPLILAADKSKLSKRKHGESISLDFYRKCGYLPEAMVNFLALLGWNPGNNKEMFSIKELIKEFSIEKVQKSGAIFDIKKLDWMNGEYIRKKSLNELEGLAKPFLPLSPDSSRGTPPYKGGETQSFPSFIRRGLGRWFPLLTKEGEEGWGLTFLQKILKLEQPRLKKLSELPGKIDYFFVEPQYDKELLRWKNMSDDELKHSLELSANLLKSIDEKNFTKENLEKMFLFKTEEMLVRRSLGESGGDKGALLWPLRASLSGKKASPGPFEIMEILGKEESIKRLENALKLF